ncbi:MAG: PAS domain-containing protein, partial [Phycisphaerae bacterium]|nr:PAS domain-containing protein [Phycisphaerae bacterium]
MHQRSFLCVRRQSHVRENSRIAVDAGVGRHIINVRSPGSPYRQRPGASNHDNYRSDRYLGEAFPRKPQSDSFGQRLEFACREKHGLIGLKMKQQRNVERGEHEAAGQIFSEDGEGAAASDHNQKQDSFLRHVSVFGAGGATLIAIFGLMGYVPGLGLLGSVREGYIPMAPSTAVSFIVLGCIVPAMTLRSPPGAILILFGVLAATVSLFGMLEVAGHFTGMDLNFEDALVPAAGHLGEIPIARMSPSTGAGFFLAGLAVFPLTLRNTVRTSRGHLEHWVGCLGSLVLAISIAFCLAYLYGTPLLYGRGATVPMALTTALGFLMLGIAAICASGRDAIPLRVLIDPSIRGYLLRLFLPLTIVSTVLGGLVVHRVTILSDVNPALVATTTAVLTASITGLITIWIARHVAAVIARSKAVRDQAMASMRESEERLSSFLDNSAVVAWMKDEDGRHVFLSDNYQKRFQVEFNDWEGKTDFELWPRETAEEFRRNDLEVLRKGESIEVVERTTNRDGGVSWWLNNKFMFQDQSGKRYVGGLGVDITERKQAEEERLSLERQVLHAQKLEGLGVLAGGIAHDFNNLLTAILGNTDLALMDLSQVSPVRGNLLEVKKTSQRAAELARQMLAYSGKGKFVIEPI